MTDARVEQTYEDPATARAHLDQAEMFLADARNDKVSNEGRAVLAHNAIIAACDAVLAADGLRVGSGDRAHVLRIDTALARLEGDADDLSERLDAARVRRNEASYSAMPVAWASLVDALEATSEPIERARRHVG